MWLAIQVYHMGRRTRKPTLWTLRNVNLTYEDEVLLSRSRDHLCLLEYAKISITIFPTKEKISTNKIENLNAFPHEDAL